jgi:WD40 repeat protein
MGFCSCLFVACLGLASLSLFAQEVQPRFTLKGHTSDVTSVAYSPNGKLIVSGSFDKTLKVWDAATGNEILFFSGHAGEVTSVAFSPDSKRIISGGRDATVKVWEMPMGK